MTRDLFEAASPIAKQRQGSRTSPGRNRHPQTKTNYQLRSYVFCDLCGHRMRGKTRKPNTYYACEPPAQHHQGRSEWYDEHPKSLWVREDALVSAVHDFFAERIFGPRRQEYLQARLQAPADASLVEAREAKLVSILADLKRRQDNLWAQLEAFEPSGDPDIDREYRSDLQHRFAKLAKERRDVQTQLGRLGTGDRSAANDPRSWN